MSFDLACGSNGMIVSPNKLRHVFAKGLDGFIPVCDVIVVEAITITATVDISVGTAIRTFMSFFLCDVRRETAALGPEKIPRDAPDAMAGP